MEEAFKQFLRGLPLGVINLHWVRVMLPTPQWRRDHAEFGEPLRIYYGGPGPNERWWDLVPCPSLFHRRWVQGITMRQEMNTTATNATFTPTTGTTGWWSGPWGSS